MNKGRCFTCKGAGGTTVGTGHRGLFCLPRHLVSKEEFAFHVASRWCTADHLLSCKMCIVLQYLGITCQPRRLSQEHRSLCQGPPTNVMSAWCWTVKMIHIPIGTSISLLTLPFGSHQGSRVSGIRTSRIQFSAASQDICWIKSIFAVS